MPTPDEAPEPKADDKSVTPQATIDQLRAEYMKRSPLQRVMRAQQARRLAKTKAK